MNVRRTNPVISGSGTSCAHCSGGKPCASCAASLVAMPWGSSNPTLVNPMPPMGGTTANNPMVWASGGYPTAINVPGSTAQALTQTSPDYPTPTALTVAQAFQSAVPGGGAQPGIVSLPYLNWTANNTTFMKPEPGPAQTCPATNWLNTSPMLLIALAFGAAYLVSR